MPKRIHLKRSKGWRIPTNTVVVSRPSKWGNPFVLDERARVSNRRIATDSFHSLLNKQAAWCSIPTHRWPRGKIPAVFTTVDDVRRELRGKDLACWCPLDEPCHADLLLDIANA